MADIKIAVIANNLRLEKEEALKTVAEMGVTGVHIGTWVPGPPSTEEASQEENEEYLRLLKKYGLEVSALIGWGGSVDLGEPEGLKENIEWGKRIANQSVALGCRLWMSHLGIMPTDESHPHWQNFLDSVGELAAYHEKIGARLAIETGPEPPRILKRLLEVIGSPTIGVNYDPANLILWPPTLAKMSDEPYDMEKAMAEFLPMDGVKVLGPHIFHSHAKDAIAKPDGSRKEVPLGEGLIDWPYYLSLFKEIGYDGYFAIEREAGDDPVRDIGKAVEFLKSVKIQ